MASVIDELIDMEHWWHGIDRGKPTCWVKHLSQCRVVYSKSYTERPGTEFPTSQVRGRRHPSKPCLLPKP